jgi:hypothetical protein
LKFSLKTPTATVEKFLKKKMNSRYLVSKQQKKPNDRGSNGHSTDSKKTKNFPSFDPNTTTLKTSFVNKKCSERQTNNSPFGAISIILRNHKSLLNHPRKAQNDESTA